MKTKLTRKERKALKNAEIQRLENERKKEEIRYKLIESTQEIIPIKDIYKGIVITDDDRFIKVMEFKPLNFMFLSPQSRNMITNCFESMLKTLPMNVQFKTFSRKANVESLVKTMRDYHEKETNPACRRMQEEYMNMLRETALAEGVTRRFLVVLEHAKSINNDGTNFDLIVSDLNSAAARAKNYLEQGGNLFIPSCETDEGVHELFYEILNRKKSETVPFDEHIEKIIKGYVESEVDGEIAPIRATELIAPAWIDYEHSKHVVVDDKFYTFAYIPSAGYDTEVISGWLSLFINACEGVDVDIFFQRLSRDEVFDKIGFQVRMKRSDALGSHDTDSDFHQLQGTISSGEYMLAGLSNGEDFYYADVLMTVVADSIDELEYKYRELEKRAKGRGIALRRTTFCMEQAFVSALPLCSITKSIHDRARRNVLTSGASSFYPFTSFEMQDPDGIMVGTNRTNNSLVTLDVFDNAIHANGNVAIAGKSGYGKTFTAQLLALRMRMKQIQTFIITPLKGREDYKRGCDHIGGQYISMAPGSRNSINVMDIHVPDEEGAKLLDGYESKGSLLTMKTHDLLTFMHLVVRDLTQEEEQLIDGCVFRTYKAYGITENNDSV
ncbi:MAG: PrgI family protein, partial [Christensenella sp.]